MLNTLFYFNQGSNIALFSGVIFFSNTNAPFRKILNSAQCGRFALIL